MLNTVILILGDLAVATFQGFYMGVGIRQSAGIRNILWMTIPTLAVWLILSFSFGIYRDIPKHESRVTCLRKEDTNGATIWKQILAFLRPLRNLARLVRKTIETQRALALVAVWLGSSAFAVLYQTWYWDEVLGRGWPFSFRFALMFAAVGIYLLIFWRIVWTLFVMLRVVARKSIPFRVLCYLATAAIVAFQIPALFLTVEYAPRRFSLDTVETVPARTAIVFGAGVYPNGQASGVLADRIKTAVELYQIGKVDTLILSGDNSDFSRNEVDVMADLSVSLGVPESALVRDETGLSTIETCVNAAESFNIHEAALITQDFHTTRALYVCDQYDVHAISVAADRASYNIFSWVMWIVRDWMGLTLSYLYFN